MQAILAMDAAQRKAMQEATEEQKNKLTALTEQKTQIAKEYAANAREMAEQKAAARRAMNQDALRQLQAKETAVTAQLDDAAAKNRAAWADELVQRTLAR